MRYVLLLMVFMLVSWGYGGSERLSQSACAQEDSGECDKPQSIIPDEDDIPGRDYTPGLLFIVINKDSLEVIAALEAASKQGTTLTGIASFDSIAAEYGLKKIEQGFKEGFLLVFPDETNLRPIVLAYCPISSIQQILVDVSFPIPAAISPKNWGSVKQMNSDP